MSAYAFLMWPHGRMPWAKPRFVLDGEQLSIQNAPLPKPEEIFSRRSIRELPYISYDRAYRETEWDRHYWRYLHSSYLFRLLISWYPVLESSSEQTSDRTMKSINTMIFRSFFRAAYSEGSIPIVVYLPDDSDFQTANNYTPVGIRIVQDAGIEPIDLTACLSRISSTERYALREDGTYAHYSPRGHAVVAECLRPVLISHLSDQKETN